MRVKMISYSLWIVIRWKVPNYAVAELISYNRSSGEKLLLKCFGRFLEQP